MHQLQNVLMKNLYDDISKLMVREKITYIILLRDFNKIGKGKIENLVSENLE